MLRKTILSLCLLALLIGPPGALLTSMAQEDDSPTARTIDTLSVYAAPLSDDEEAEPIATLPPQTIVTLKGRSVTGAWLQIRTADGVVGWATREKLALDDGVVLADLPVISEPAPSAASFNMHTGPDPAYALVAVLPYGARMAVTGRNFDGTWLLAHTSDGRLRGWVEARHVTLDANISVFSLPVINTLSDPHSPAAEGITLRAGPGEDYPAGDVVEPGTRLQIEGRDTSGAWLLVHTDDRNARGWIAAGNMTLNDSVTLDTLAVIEDPANLDPLAPPTIDLRDGPGMEHPVTASVPWGTRLSVDGRNHAATWLLVSQSDNMGVRGWIEAGDMTLDAGTTLLSLPVIDETVTVAAASQPSTTGDDPNIPALPQPPVNPPDEPTLDAMVARLYGVPAVPVSISARARQILQQGAQSGMRPDVFSKIGDCHTAHLGFMLPLGVNEYELGPYSYLQTALDYFSATSPRQGVPNSFENASFAALSSFTASSVLDPVWANPDYCSPGESSLACEYRIVRPNVAIIMLGTMDVTVYNVETFEVYMRRVVQETISRGVLPVLTTFPSDTHRYWPESLKFNVVLLNIARDEQIPVINLWLAARSLPNNGLVDDYLHLSYKGERRLNVHGASDRWMSFSGDELTWGHTLRNLVTLQTLDLIRRSR